VSLPSQSPPSIALSRLATYALNSTSFLNPGGVIELQDIIYPMCSDDGTLTQDTPLKRWSDMLNDAFAGMGRGMDSAKAYPKQLAEAGFVDIEVVREKWPTNHWPKDKKYKQIGA